jgi:PKD repeat protein
MKTSTSIKLKKMLGIAVLCLELNGIVSAQCHAGYTYTAGSSVNFTNTSTGTTGSTVYHWYFGDGGSSSIASPTHTYQYNGNYNANLSIWDSAGNCFDSTSQIITITNALTCNIAASFSYSAGSNGQINFTSTATNVPTGAIYSWDFEDGSGSTQISPSHSYYFNGTYTVSLHISDSTYYCSNTTSQVVTVSNGNICNMKAGLTYTIMSNGQVAFTNSSTGMDTMTRFIWGFGDGSEYWGSSTTHTYAYNGTYYVNLRVWDTLTNCNSSITDTIKITNTVNAPVCTASFIDSLDNNGLVLFISISSGAISSNTMYSWSFGDGGTSTIQNPYHTYSVNGTYLVTLHITDSLNLCFSSITDTINITNAGPAPCLPTVSFNMHKDSLNPQPGVWEIGASYSSQVTAAKWFWGDGSYTTGLNPTHNYATAGQYTICVRVYSACGDSTTICQNDSLYRLSHPNSTNSMISVTVLNVNATGIKTNIPETAQIALYPNPNAGVFTLRLSGASVTKAQISISNILGEVVYSSQEQLSNNTFTKEIDLQNMANGAYFMQVSMGSYTKTQKIIINK